MEITLTFLKFFFLALYLLAPLLCLLLILIIALGQVVGKIENWSKLNTLYWTFITALTVGYGDIRPNKNSSKLLSVIIAMLGIMFTGVIVAITVSTAGRALNSAVDVNALIEKATGQ